MAPSGLKLKACLIGTMVVVCLAWSAEAGSAIYRWRDQYGKLHFTDNPESIPIESFNPRDRIQHSSRTQPLAAPDETSVSMDVRLGAIQVPVQINGVHPVSLFLDTGATFCQITWEDARALGLDVDHLPPVRVKTADGRTTDTRIVVLDTMEIGSLEVRGVKALIGDLRLLGLNVLKRFRVIIDFPQNRITLQPSP
jgi:clan AA aspartic protease (TIGR02281 family)